MEIDEKTEAESGGSEIIEALRGVPQVGSVTPIQRPDSSGLYVLGNSALLFKNVELYDPFSNFIFQQNGDVRSLDLTNAPGDTVDQSFDAGASQGLHLQLCC